MITCSVLRESHYPDSGMEDDIGRVIADLAHRDDNIRFLFYFKYPYPRRCENEEFDSICVSQIISYRKLRPERKMSIILVGDSEDMKRWADKTIRDYPHCPDASYDHYDGYLQAPESPDIVDSFAKAKRVCKWGIQQSDVLLCCYYDIFTRFQPPVKFRNTIKHESCEVINCKRSSTEKQLHALADELPARKKEIITALQEGQRVQEIAQRMGISDTRVMAIYQSAARDLRAAYRDQQSPK